MKTRNFVSQLLLCVVAVFISGCSNFQVQPDPMKQPMFFQRDLVMTVNGVPCRGVCTVRRAPAYEVKIESKQDVDQLVISSCKRTEVIPSAIDTGWLKKKRSYVYRFTPGLIEQEPNCYLEIGGFDKDRGQHSWGMITFEHAAFTMRAGLSCNADPDRAAEGVAICQAMQGQKMMIWFDRPVRIAQSDEPGKSKIPDRCRVPIPPDGRGWKFNIAPQKCDYVFRSVNQPFQNFLLTTIGAEQIPIRGEL